MADLNRTLKESVHYPPHGPRRGPAYKIFNAARHHLIDVLDAPCWICGVTKTQLAAGLSADHPAFGATAMEAHHNLAEFSALPEIDWQKVSADFPQLGIHSDEEFLCMAESEGGLLILCSIHHRSPYRGIHAITEPAWKLQRYELAGWDFTKPPTCDPTPAPAPAPAPASATVTVTVETTPAQVPPK